MRCLIISVSIPFQERRRHYLFEDPAIICSVKQYQPLLAQINQDLKAWDKVCYSWLERAAILKINILLQQVYILQAVPVSLPRENPQTQLCLPDFL